MSSRIAIHSARRVALDHSKIIAKPKNDWLYNNYNPLLLGIRTGIRYGLENAAAWPALFRRFVDADLKKIATGIGVIISHGRL